MSISRRTTSTGGGGTGADGRGIVSVARTSGTGSPGTTDTYTITYTDGTTSTFAVTNGVNGTGGAGASLSIRQVTGDTSLTNSDNGKLVSVNVTAPAVAVVTIPTGLTGSLAAPFECLIGRRGTGSVSIAKASGVTLIPDDTRNTIATLGGKASLIHEGSDAWWIDGTLI